uniref:Uncharacterized protein n=1 Tax=Amphimedon queenslandica TaxID=400682 RepID=A0A1X7VVV9_AMPQE
TVTTINTANGRITRGPAAGSIKGHSTSGTVKTIVNTDTGPSTKGRSTRCTFKSVVDTDTGPSTKGVAPEALLRVFLILTLVLQERDVALEAYKWL